MLIEFRVSNYRSIAEEQALTFIPATNQRDFPENIIKRGKHLALNALAVWGANGSGKSNLLHAIELMDKIIHHSGHNNSTAKLPYSPNLLVEGWSQQPTSLQVVFVLNGIRYRYGFSYTAEAIHDEWLYRKKIGRETELFTRQGEIIDVSSGFEGNTKVIDAAVESTRRNGLFLSACDTFNLSEAQLIFQWFKRLISIDGINTQKHESDTLDLIQADPSFKIRVVNYLRALDLGFNDLRVVTSGTSPKTLIDTPDESFRVEYIKDRGTRVETQHDRYKKDGQNLESPIFWPLGLHESAGTIKAFQLSGPILLTLENGGVLVIDEIEAKQHTKLTKAIVQLFLDTDTNPKQAQLIFATHDTNLLNRTTLRRDQICFAEKDKKEATHLFSLSEFRYFKGNKVRPDTDKEKRYLEDRYGATPKISTKELVVTS